MLRFNFNKLIRHKLPSRMEEEGVFVSKKLLNKSEYLEKLKLKLMEETEEALAAVDYEDLKQELADILEVIHSITEVMGRNIDLIEAERIKKREANGRFSPENYVHYIEVPKEKEKIINYLRDRRRPYKFSDLK